MLKKTIGAALLAALPLMAQNSAEIDLNSDDIEIAGKYELGQSFDYDGRSSRNYLHAAYLYSGESHTRGKNLVEFGYLATGTLGDFTRLRFGIGIKAALAEDYVAIPLGLTVHYRVPVEWPVSLSGEVYAAPDPLVFSDGEGYGGYRFGVESKLIPNATIYAGYRNIDLKYKDDSKNFNDGWYAGVRFHF
ncbi:YfaZ family outer membrane protein [Hydrogenimonas sp.]